MTGSGGSSSSLYTIDPTTGATTLIGATGQTHMTGIDFDPTTGILYGVQSDYFGSGATNLFSINTSTGAASLIGATGAQIPDITIGADGVIRGWSEFDGNSRDDPVVINKTTGTATTTLSSLGTARTGVASLDATHIYVMDSSRLSSVDVLTGAATFLFSGFSSDNLLENMPSGGLIYGDRTGGGTQFSRLEPLRLLGFHQGFSSLRSPTVLTFLNPAL
jgi:hypothetical protein